MAGKHRRPAEQALLVPDAPGNDWWKATEGPRSQRLAEPNTWRTQAVDLAASKDTPHIAANTMSRCVTTMQDMHAHAHDVRSMLLLEACLHQDS